MLTRIADEIAPVHALAKHLASVGVSDDALAVIEGLNGPVVAKHHSFFKLIGVKAAA